MSTTSDKFVQDMLLKGRSIDFVADASGFPREHVERVLQELRESRNGIPATAEPTSENSGIIPGQSLDNSGTVTERDEAKPRQLGNLASTPTAESDTLPERVSPGRPSLPEMREQVRQVQQPRPEFNARATNAVALMARAADMDDRRVQGALGRARKAMTDLAAEVNRYDEQNGARERLAELQAEIDAIKSQLRGGKVTESRPKRTMTDAEREAMQERFRNDEPCTHGCGFIAKSKAGKSAHERNCQHPEAASA